MNTPPDLKIITQYKQYKLRTPIYTSRETQQIYDSSKYIRTCDTYGRVIVEVLDNRNEYTGCRYARFSRAALLKYNNDYKKEKEAPKYRMFDENHKIIE